ncbi:MAG: TonB-dependent receptor, partial [Bacteroidota bacterium]
MNIFLRISLFLFLCCFLQLSFAQSPGVVKGKVIDPNNRPIQGVKVSVNEEAPRFTTAADGLYEITLTPGRYLIKFTHPTHEAAQLDLTIVSDYIYNKPVKMLELTLEESLILEERKDPPQLQLFPIEAEEILKMPAFNRSVEAAVKFLPGVASNNEFSSQYQVRGGNFDENLVYVNGIEIYRPFLSRNGQQEGLGFSNPDMAQEIKFSTGGFAAQYGDKLSSVLDITYRTPEKFRGTVEAGFLTQSLHLEGTSASKKRPNQPGRFTYLLGARRFSTSYLLNSLETRGEYQPEFLDVQSMFTFTPKTASKETKYRLRGNDTTRTIYYPRDRVKLTGFLALTRNRYQFEPDGRETTFGTIQQAFRLRTGFEGRETSNYTTGLGALMLTHQPTTNLQFNYTFTAFRTDENELFDVEGGYLLGEVNTSFGSDEFNESEFDLGIGSEYRHARNYLRADV